MKMIKFIAFSFVSFSISSCAAAENATEVIQEKNALVDSASAQNILKEKDKKEIDGKESSESLKYYNATRQDEKTCIVIPPDKSSTQHIKPELTEYHYNKITSQPDDISFKISDLITAIISLIALALTCFAHQLNIKNFKTAEKNRITDKNEGDYTFWLKDVVFPKYISEIISLSRDFDSNLAKYKKDFSKDEEILKNIDDIKHKISVLTIEGSKIPFFNTIFTKVNSQINDIYDKFVEVSFDSESFVFINNSPASSNTKNLDANYKIEAIEVCQRMLSDVSSEIFSNIKSTQQKIRESDVA